MVGQQKLSTRLPMTGVGKINMCKWEAFQVAQSTANGSLY